MIAEKENEHLKLRCEEIKKEIEAHGKSFDEDFEKKRKDVDQMKQVSDTRLETVKVELAKSDEYKTQTAEYEAFCAKFEPLALEIEESMAKYESDIHASVKDFDRPLKKIDKVR